MFIYMRVYCSSAVRAASNATAVRLPLLNNHLTGFTTAASNLLTRNPFFYFFRGRISTALIQYSYFHLHNSSSLNSALRKAAFLPLGELLSHLLRDLANLLI